VVGSAEVVRQGHSIESPGVFSHQNAHITILEFFSWIWSDDAVTISIAVLYQRVVFYRETGDHPHLFRKSIVSSGSSIFYFRGQEGEEK
jgi:hypothetical protein